VNFIRIIPSLLISNGKLVKGSKFENFKNAGSPVTTVAALDSQIADEIFIIDIDSYNKKKKPDFKTLKKIAEVSSTPITFGGGIDSLETAKKIFLNGADKIFLNTILFNNLNIIHEISSVYGNQAIIGGMNVIKKNNKYYLLEDKNLKIDPIEYAKKLEKLGVAEIKIIYVDLEGTKKGIDYEYSKKINESVKIPCIFEGGLGNLEQLSKCFDYGLNSIAIGTMIIFSDYNIIKIKNYLKEKKRPVRL
jgi:imidazole glycerol-phosphate synthase subunit HisF